MTPQTSSPTTTARVTPTGCCPPFDPASYHEKEITWYGKPFVKEHLHTVLHVPLDMKRKVTKAMRKIDAAKAAPAHALMLSDDLSPWRSDLYIEVTGDVPGAEMATLSGKFMTRVYEGPFRDAPKWCEDMKAWVATQGKKAGKLYLAYTTCPACAKAYGKNYVVVFAETS